MRTISVEMVFEGLEDLSVYDRFTRTNGPIILAPRDYDPGLEVGGCPIHDGRYSYRVGLVVQGEDAWSNAPKWSFLYALTWLDGLRRLRGWDPGPVTFLVSGEALVWWGNEIDEVVKTLALPNTRLYMAMLTKVGFSKGGVSPPYCVRVLQHDKEIVLGTGLIGTA